MGGFMSYSRMRGRNGIGPRPAEGQHSYFLPATEPNISKSYLAGEMNRMERDYLGLDSARDGLAQDVADRAGCDLDTVRRVLRAVFEDTNPEWIQKLGPVTDGPYAHGGTDD